MRVLLGFILSIVLSLVVTAAEAAGRVALVFSAQSYKFLRPLDNPDRDAQAVADALRKLGFEVTVEPDRTLRKMRRALEDFREEAGGADVAFVYFAGHGVEIAGENRLLPIDADASSLEILKETSLPLEEVREAAAAVAPAVLIALDACRNDPFGVEAGAEGRSAAALSGDVKVAAKPGLGRIGEAENTLFVFSAAPGKTAADGDGANSPFSAALAKYLSTDGLEIRSVLTLVQQEVYDSSKGRQSPWVESAPFPSLFFAAETGAIPERERLLLAMADVTPELRDEVESVAATTDVPLAPLYGALIAADLKSLTAEERGRKLAESARAYVTTQEWMKTFSSADPDVTRLRAEAEKSLALGAFAEARETLAAAAAIDANSGDLIAANLVERRLSEAATRVAESGVARTQLDYRGAITVLERAATLHKKIEAEQLPDSARADRNWLLSDLGDLKVQVGDTGGALDAYERMRAAAAVRVERSAGEPDAERDLSVSLEKIGDIRISQGDLDGALKAYSDGLAIQQNLAAIDDYDIDWQRDLSRFWTKVGDVNRAQGEWEDALQAYLKAQAITKRLTRLDAEHTGLPKDLFVNRISIGDVLIARNDLTGALQAYSESLAIAKERAAKDESDLAWQRDLSVSLNKIGDVKLAHKDPAGALQAYTDSLAIREELAARFPGDSRLQRDLSFSWGRIGEAKFAIDDLAGAQEAYTKSLGISQKLVALDGSNASWQSDLFADLTKVGDVKITQGDKAGALQAYSEGFVIAEKLAAQDKANAVWRRNLVSAHVKLAQAGGDPRVHYAAALAIVEAMESEGVLAPGDATLPGLLRQALTTLR